MPVTSQVSTAAYTGDGGSTAFPVPFYFLLATDLVVTVNGITSVLGVAYTVSGVRVSSGGTVTFLAAPAIGAAVTIARQPPLTQLVQAVDNQALLAATLNDALDKLTMLIQGVSASLQSQVSALQAAAGSPGAYRVITAPGAVAVGATDTAIVLAKVSSGASPLTLPASAGRNGVALLVIDITGDANTNNVTIAPATGESINGLSAAAAAAFGLTTIDTDYGSKIFYPLVSGGWFVR